MLELEEPTLLAASARWVDEGATPSITLPDDTAHLRGDVAGCSTRLADDSPRIQFGVAL